MFIDPVDELARPGRAVALIARSRTTSRPEHQVGDDADEAAWSLAVRTPMIGLGSAAMLGSLMNRKMTYRKIAVATTRRPRTWRGSAAPDAAIQSIRTASGRIRTAKIATAISSTSRYSAAGRLEWPIVGQEEQRQGDDQAAREQEADLDEPASRAVGRAADAPLDEAHRDQDQVAEDHRRGVGTDDVRIGREQARPARRAGSGGGRR